MATAGTSDISKNWISYLRSSHLFSCPFCDANVQPANLTGFKQHVQKNSKDHPEDEAGIIEAFERMRINSSKPLDPSTTNIDAGQGQAKQSRKRQALEADEDNDDLGSADDGDAGEGRDNKKLCSPRNSPPPPTTSPRARGKKVEKPEEFDRRNVGVSNRQLWSPDDGQPQRSAQSKTNPPGSRTRLSRHIQQQQQQQQQHQDLDQGQLAEDPSVTYMIRQPETRPISAEQLVAEVKGIYAGLVMVESKCIEVDNVQSSSKDAPKQLSNEQWQALIALHRTLLHEHHDFFLASQHPSASPALRRLAAKYAMPARMWRHGIHSFLELLRHKLPLSLEPMLTFIYIAYSMMALLYETVPAFEDTWIECLGDLGRYRMAIEDDDIKDRETWTAVSRYWYSKASDKSPTTGRLYHHLAILARPNALQQVYYYTKSLCVPTPFLSARESVMTLFDPVLSENPPRMEPIDLAFVRVHAILFSDKSKDQLAPSMKQFLSLLDGHVARITKRWLESGYFIGISITCSLLGYGDESNVLKRAISKRPTEEDHTVEQPVSSESFNQALLFSIRTLEVVIRRWGDMNILPFLHTQMVFLHHLSKFPAAMAHIESKYPWKLTAMMLNYLKQSCKFEPRIEDEAFPGAQKGDHPRPLPEDYAMRGLIYTEVYFPDDWFTGDTVDGDEKYFEQGSMIDVRKERILWIGKRIASMGKWLTWDEASGKFSVVGEYDVELGSRTTPEFDSLDFQDEEDNDDDDDDHEEDEDDDGDDEPEDLDDDIEFSPQPEVIGPSS